MRGRFTVIIALGLSLGGTGVAVYHLMGLMGLSEGLKVEAARELASTQPASEFKGEANNSVEDEDGNGRFESATSVTVGEILVNVNADYPDTHFLRLQMNLDLFDPDSRAFVIKRKTAIKSLVIELLRQQHYDSIVTLRGKLYFKELLTSKLNAYLRYPVVREIHFADFYLQ